MSYTTQTTLLNRMRDGDSFSWQEFYEKYKNFILLIGRHSKLQPEELEDLLQNVMYSIFRSDAVATYDKQRGTFRTYLQKIIRCKIVDIQRARNRRSVALLPGDMPLEELPDANALETNDFDEYYNRQYAAQVLNLMLDELRQVVEPGTLQAFQLTYLQRIPTERAAEMLEMTADAVYQARSRCLQHLKRIGARLRREDPGLLLDL